MGMGPFDERNTKTGVAGGAGVRAFPEKPRKAKAPKLRRRVPKTATLEEGIGDETATRISDDVMIQLADNVYKLTVEALEIPLAPYQTEFAIRFIRSVMLEDVAELTCLFARQAGKCLAKGTEVLMFDGTIRPVEDIRAGDLLMGDDGTARTVLSLARGKDQMYRVVPNNGYHEPYTVNSAHILTLFQRDRRGPGAVVDVPVADVLHKKKEDPKFSGIKAVVDFPSQPTPVDPYWFGLWLGDGSGHDLTRLTLSDLDVETVEYLEAYAAHLGMRVSRYGEKGACASYAIVNHERHGAANPLLDAMRALRVGADAEDKHIPQVFKSNGREARAAVLAGIIDTDGYRSTDLNHQSTCEIASSRLRFAKDVQWLARSLGLRAGLRKKLVNGVDYWQVTLYGALWEIPTRVARRKYEQRELRENPLLYGFSVEPVGFDDYYGFAIDGNKRFLLGDFTITHNTEVVADVLAGLMVLLPTLAQQIPDERLAKFKNGIHIGVYGPSYYTIGLICSRLLDRLYGQGMREVMQDEEVGIDIPEGAKALSLPNGSRVEAYSTHPKIPLEGPTHHLIITDETQFIADIRMKKAIRPTGARTAATIVMLGTPGTERCEFYDACQRNRRHDLNLANKDKWKQQHFESDWKECARWSKRYMKYVEAERDRLGEESDEFRMAYRLHWILERSTFVSSEELNECGLRKNRLLRRSFGHGKVSLFMCSANLVTFDSKNRHVAGIDIGRDGDSTVITILRVWWDNPVKVGDKTVYFCHVANWLELHGDDHEKQYPEIVDFLKNYRLDCVVVDATGRGDPIYDRLRAELKVYDVPVVAFVFNQATKHQGYTLLQQEVKHSRVTYPAGHVVAKQTKFKRFKQQFEDLEKGWRGKYMVVEAPKRASGGRRVKDMHDDYPDSLMLALYGTQSTSVLQEVEVSKKNPFYTKNPRREKMRDARAWFRG